MRGENPVGGSAPTSTLAHLPPALLGHRFGTRGDGWPKPTPPTPALKGAANLVRGFLRGLSLTHQAAHLSGDVQHPLFPGPNPHGFSEDPKSPFRRNPGLHQFCKDEDCHRRRSRATLFSPGKALKGLHPNASLKSVGSRYRERPIGMDAEGPMSLSESPRIGVQGREEPPFRHTLGKALQRLVEEWLGRQALLPRRRSHGINLPKQPGGN